MLDVRRLRVLCEVARQGSLSAAASALGYTQPAISRQVAQLEAEVGTLLVRRVPQGVVLTDAGRLLVARSETILTQLDGIETELHALRGLEGGRVRFAAFASACASIVPLAIAQFRERFPAVELTVSMSDPGDSLPRLLSGELDLIMTHEPLAAPAVASDSVTVTEGAPRGGIDIVHLFDDPMYLAMPVGHPLAGADPLSLEMFASDPWMIATSLTCPDSRLLLRACHAAGFEPRIAFENDDYSAILGFVAAGVGVGLIPDMVARGMREDVVIRRLEPPAPARPIAVALAAGYRSPAVEALLGVLREVAEEWADGDGALLARQSRTDSGAASGAAGSRTLATQLGSR